MRKVVASPKAPKAVGPYSQAVLTHQVPGAQMLHAAGQIPIDPDTGELVGEDVAAQAERVMENIAAVLEHAGMSFDDVVKTTVFLVDLADFAAMNEAYARRFSGEFPARSTIQVAGLPRGARVEIEVHAVKHPPASTAAAAARPKAKAKAKATARPAARKAKPAAKRASRPARPAAKARRRSPR